MYTCEVRSEACPRGSHASTVIVALCDMAVAGANCADGRSVCEDGRRSSGIVVSRFCKGVAAPTVRWLNVGRRGKTDLSNY